MRRRGVLSGASNAFARTRGDGGGNMAKHGLRPTLKLKVLITYGHGETDNKEAPS